MFLEKSDGSIAAPAVFPGEQVQLQVSCGSRGFINLLYPVKTCQCAVYLKTGVLDSDVHQQRSRRNQSLKFRQISQRDLSRRDLHSTVVQIVDSELLP